MEDDRAHALHDMGAEVTFFSPAQARTLVLALLGWASNYCGQSRCRRRVLRNRSSTRCRSSAWKSFATPNFSPLFDVTVPSVECAALGVEVMYFCRIVPPPLLGSG